MTAPPPRRRAAPAAPARAAPAVEPEALAQAMRAVVQPLATLAIAHGLPFAALEESLKLAFVDAARAQHPSLPAHRVVSRIATATGINRREVSRLTQPRRETTAPPRSPATRVFTKWLADPALRARGGGPAALPRQGPAPSFEALARSVTQDVHPRSLLDEMCRLGLARVDGDTVHAVGESFVPRGDAARLLGFVGGNVGDHLKAAVANVLAATPRHLEQAVFADGLSAASLDAFGALVRTQWTQLLAATAPALQALIDADRAAGRPGDQRVRVGLYGYHEASDGAAAAPEAAEPAAASALAAPITGTTPATRRPARPRAPRPHKNQET